MILVRHSGLGEFVTVTANGCKRGIANRIHTARIPLPEPPRHRGQPLSTLFRCGDQSTANPHKGQQAFREERAHGPQDAHALASPRCRPCLRIDPNNPSMNY